MDLFIFFIWKLHLTEFNFIVFIVDLDVAIVKNGWAVKLLLFRVAAVCACVKIQKGNENRCSLCKQNERAATATTTIAK